MTLYDLKIGDQVLMFSYGSASVGIVTRLTKTQVEVTRNQYVAKYRKSDGTRISKFASRSDYIRAHSPKEIEDYFKRMEEGKELQELQLKVRCLGTELQQNSFRLNKEQCEQLIHLISNHIQ